jgi:hypothetical protein
MYRPIFLLCIFLSISCRGPVTDGASVSAMDDSQSDLSRLEPFSCDLSKQQQIQIRAAIDSHPNARIAEVEQDSSSALALAGSPNGVLNARNPCTTAPSDLLIERFLLGRSSKSREANTYHCLITITKVGSNGGIEKVTTAASAYVGGRALTPDDMERIFQAHNQTMSGACGSNI